MCIRDRRVVSCCIRPVLWYYALDIYLHARRRPTPEVVAEAFIAAQQRPPIVLNNRLAVAYIAWLMLTSSYLYHLGGDRDAAEQMLWGHCKLSLYSFAVQKIFSIGLFVYLINSDAVMRGLHGFTLDEYSTVRVLQAGDVADAGNDARRAGAPLSLIHI